MKIQPFTLLSQNWQPIAMTFEALGGETRQCMVFLFEEGKELFIKKGIAFQFDLGRTPWFIAWQYLKRRIFWLSTAQSSVILDALERLCLYAEEECVATTYKHRKNQP